MRGVVLFGAVLLAGCDPKDGETTGTVGDTGGSETETDAAVDADGDGSPEGEDCDDGDAQVNPSASEVCDGIDNDCDGQIDDADASLDVATTTIYYGDVDGDGYGDDALAQQACAQPSGAAALGGDCADDDASISPEASEVCDGVDNDCDGLTDDVDDSLDLSTAETYYADSDGDGFGDVASQVLACSPSSDYVLDSTDCDDTDADVSPRARESCNGADDDCDPNTTDDGTIDLNGVGYAQLDVALSAATSGDTITLCDGTYSGAFTVPDGVTLTSYGGAAATILESDGSSVAILTLEGGVSILDLTFRDGFALYGGAIDGYSGATVGGNITIYDSVFEGNTAGYGGAILANLDHTLTLSDTTFTGNAAGVTDGTSYYGSGGAVYAADLDVSGCTFEDNTGYFGGALYLEGSAAFDSATIVSGNAAVGWYVSSTDYGGGYGGGFMGREADITFDATIIEDNTAELFGGGGLTFSSDITGGTFRDNTADVSGGGLYYLVEDANTLSEVTLSSNTAGNGGGAVLDGNSGAGIITVSDVYFETNYASALGGGAWAIGGIIEASDTTFDGNEAAATGGAAHLGGEGEAYEVLMVCDSVEVYDNVADQGAGYFVQGSELELAGGLVAGNSAASEGGGAYLTGSLLESDATDWDSASGADNSPDDVYIEDAEESYDSFGAGESFSCDDASCE